MTTLELRCPRGRTEEDSSHTGPGHTAPRAELADLRSLDAKPPAPTRSEYSAISQADVESDHPQCLGLVSDESARSAVGYGRRFGRLLVALVIGGYVTPTRGCVAESTGLVIGLDLFMVR